jgi:hypothetical protein
LRSCGTCCELRCQERVVGSYCHSGAAVRSLLEDDEDGEGNAHPSGVKSSMRRSQANQVTGSPGDDIANRGDVDSIRIHSQGLASHVLEGFDDSLVDLCGVDSRDVSGGVELDDGGDRLCESGLHGGAGC